MMTAAPVSRWAVLSTSRICACTVTSSAVVGSSAMIRSGSFAIAMAITARCRIPPENSCGKPLARRSGLGMPTRSRSSTARFQAAAEEMSWWIWSASTIWAPMLKIGVSEESGSWKIIPMCLPRTFDIARSSRARMLFPPRVTSPVTEAYSGSSPMTAIEVTDFPEPDSPTMPRVLPRCRSKETPRTASTRPASEGKLTRRSRTDSNGCRVSVAVVMVLCSVMRGLRTARWGRGRPAGRPR